MERDPRLSTFVHTNVLLANLCDTKMSVRQRGPFQPIAAHQNPGILAFVYRCIVSVKQKI